MTICELKKTLEQHAEKKIRFVLPDQSVIPAHFHITEVGHVQKNFIDCGGTQRATSCCLLQAWVAANDTRHALAAGRLVRILGLAAAILPNEDLPVEVEFEAPFISQFPIRSTEMIGDAVVFHLAAKHTDCLAKEQCGVEEDSSCCSAESGCC